VAAARDTWIAVGVAVVSIATMAIDHLIGTENERDESQAAEPIAFVASAALALALTAVLFHFVVRPARRDPDVAVRRAILYSAFAVATVPLLFLAVPFPFAGAAIALGLVGRDGRRPRLATAAVVIGALIVALGLAAYLAELV
jgi:cytochrome bd-type quinol oxidase subunit 2